MEGEAPLDGQQKELRTEDRNEDNERDEPPPLPSADESQENKGRLHGTSAEDVEEEEKENSGYGDRSQKKKQNQIDQRRDISHQSLEGTISEEEIARITYRCLDILESTEEFGRIIPQRNNPVKCPTCYMEEQFCHCLERGESPRGSPEDTRFSTRERSNQSLRSLKCFSGSALEIPQLMDSEAKHYCCMQCDMSFREGSGLKSHQRTHTGEKPYKCDECEKEFKHPSHLTSHQRIHTGERPYTCKECGKCFRHHSSVKKHQRVHSGEKPYHCDKCEKSFGRNDILRVHQRIHTGEKPYICKECGKGFSCSSIFSRHQRVHSGEKPFQCNECGKTFSRRCHLITHERIHSGEKPYVCKECGKSFTQRCHLMTHERIHSGGKPYAVVPRATKRIRSASRAVFSSRGRPLGEAAETGEPGHHGVKTPSSHETGHWECNSSFVSRD